MFFPKQEYPTQAVQQELQQLGVVCSVLPDLVPPQVANSSQQLTDTEGIRLAGFSMKSAAVLLSAFEEVRAWQCSIPAVVGHVPLNFGVSMAVQTCVSWATVAEWAGFVRDDKATDNVWFLPIATVHLCSHMICAFYTITSTPMFQ